MKKALPMSRGRSDKAVGRSPLRNTLYHSQRFADSDKVEIFKSVANVMRSTAALSDILVNCYETRLVANAAQHVINASKATLELIQMHQQCILIVDELENIVVDELV